jgi:imidazolonepropionase-like amidohydrolase
MNLVQWVLDPIELRAARGVADVRALIEAGYTAVRCAGSNTSVSLAKAIKEKTIPGPHIVASHYGITQTGGQMDKHMFPSHWLTGPHAYARIADGADDCRKAAREQIRAGADVVKILSTGGVLSEKGGPTQAQLIPEEIAAITTEAHRAGLKVMAHAESQEGIRNSLLNGVDTIEHAMYLDEETVNLLLKYKTIIVPTLSILNALCSKGKDAGTPEFAIRKAESAQRVHQESIRMAYRAGVRIAAGSDFLGTEIMSHGSNAVELELLEREVGMTRMEVLQAATVVGAEALGMEDDIGTLEAGKLADVLVVDGNPLEDVRLLQEKNRILLVIKEGDIMVDRRFQRMAESSQVSLR